MVPFASDVLAQAAKLHRELARCALKFNRRQLSAIFRRLPRSQGFRASEPDRSFVQCAVTNEERRRQPSKRKNDACTKQDAIAVRWVAETLAVAPSIRHSRTERVNDERTSAVIVAAPFDGANEDGGD